MRLVACRTLGCGRADIVRTVPDTVVARAIVTRPPLYCAECGAEMIHAGESVPDPTPESEVETPTAPETDDPPKRDKRPTRAERAVRAAPETRGR